MLVSKGPPIRNAYRPLGESNGHVTYDVA